MRGFDVETKGVDHRMNREVEEQEQAVPAKRCCESIRPKVVSTTWNRGERQAKKS